jgi:hypothetical protein
MSLKTFSTSKGITSTLDFEFLSHISIKDIFWAGGLFEDDPNGFRLEKSMKESFEDFVTRKTSLI